MWNQEWDEIETICGTVQALSLGSNNLNGFYNMFAIYIEDMIASIPWCETPLEPEAFLIQPQLVEQNLADILSSNSQPSVNGTFSVWAEEAFSRLFDMWLGL